MTLPGDKCFGLADESGAIRAVVSGLGTNGQGDELWKAQQTTNMASARKILEWN